MELNREQIIKALQGHIGVVDMRCEECPYNQDNGSEICIDLLITDALALINSQEQRIKELEAENERLKAQKYYIHSDGRIEMIPTVESVRADTVRKMQQRLKEKYTNHSWGGLYVPDYMVDQIVKEMLEGDDEN